MTFLFCLLIGYFFILLGYIIILLILFHTNEKDRSANQYDESNLPFVSILIAARNEEDTILRCLTAISALSWPKDKFEVLIGNDNSSDNTAFVVKEYIKDKPNFKLIDITKQLGHTKGKANVLAVLAREAKGNFFFITDADIQVPTYWIQSLMANYNPTIGIVSGATTVESKSIFDYCQKMDWVYAFGMVKTVSDSNIPVSGVGNNMMISKEAYLSTGGYENIPFSITEDLQLFLETLQKGWKYKNLLSPDCIAYTKPISNFGTLLEQRKRWMQGAVQLPFVLVLFLVIQALFIPMLITTLIYFPLIGIAFWLAKITLQQLFLWSSFQKTGEHYSILKNALLFEGYTGFLSIVVFVNYFIPRKIDWKGRKY
jgi:1,2-diacylglycerol 3-beta-glucosyltransferase